MSSSILPENEASSNGQRRCAWCDALMPYWNTAGYGDYCNTQCRDNAYWTAVGVAVANPGTEAQAEAWQGGLYYAPIPSTDKKQLEYSKIGDPDNFGGYLKCECGAEATSAEVSHYGWCPKYTK